MNGRALIVGSAGKLATALLQCAPPDTHCIGRTHAQLDIADATALDRAIAEVEPALVINGSAYNFVDRAESDGMDDCVRVNVLGVGRLAQACRKAGVPLLHFSTDYVFDGHKRAPYVEDDTPNPLGVYAATKLAGENLTLAASGANYVVRVCRLFGPAAPGDRPVGNFPALMLQLARERGRVRVVDDQLGSPSYTPDVARAVWQLIDCGAPGLYHLCNAGEVTFADYAREIFRVAGIDCKVDAVSSDVYGAPARRPLYSTLDCGKAYSAGVTPLRHWSEALAAHLSSQST
jgi:dTDP-4-dehydrorhamnose reductase